MHKETESAGGVSNTVKNAFNEWLGCSGLTMNEFTKRVNGDSFTIKFYHTNDNARFRMVDEDGEIGDPIDWDTDLEISYDDFQMCIVLMLYYIGGKCHNEKSLKEINDFLVEEIVRRI